MDLAEEPPLTAQFQFLTQLHQKEEVEEVVKIMFQEMDQVVDLEEVLVILVLEVVELLGKDIMEEMDHLDLLTPLEVGVELVA